MMQTDPKDSDQDSTDPARELTQPRVIGYRLVIYPPLTTPFHHIGSGTVTMGRGTDVGIQFDDPRASRSHAEVFRKRDGRYEIADKDSRNGLFVNGRRVRSTTLHMGDVIRVGDTLMVWETGPFEPHLCLWNKSLALTMLELEAAKLARTRSPILLLGPTGAGKSWLADWIAQRSAYAKPFVHVNCAALPPSLIEAELFGAARGAFTGSNSERVGLLESAEGGSVFLDEVATLSTDLQAKLLTAIEKQEIRRIGNTRPVRLNVRFISATNVEIEAAIESGLFRQDLYYRLAAYEVVLPALAERRVDIVPAAIGALGVADHRVFTPEALEALLVAPWPGNLRELLNLAERLPRTRQRIDYSDLPPALTGVIHNRGLEDSDAEIRPSRESVLQALESNDWNVSATARSFNKHRTQVQRWMHYYRIERK